MDEFREMGPGEPVLQKLKESCQHADRVQERLLLELLDKNSGTEFGRKYRFSGMKSVGEYQALMPVTGYEDYEDFINRGIRGEKRLLTEEEPVFYCISSGSTHLPKYLPVTEQGLRLQKAYMMDAVAETVIRDTGASKEELFGKIFETGEFFKTFMPGGAMNGVRSGALHRWLEQKGEIPWERYTAPREVLFPEKLEDMLYVKLRFALACPSVTGIHGVFVHRLVGLFGYILQNWDALLHDMETGGVSDCFSVSEPWKAYLRDRLPPDPQRAAKLRATGTDCMEEGLVRRIWPDIRYIRVIGGSIFASYMERLKVFAGDLPIHYYIYAASEGIFGLPLSLGGEDAYYVLIPDACFFEFIPESDGAGDTREAKASVSETGASREVKTFRELEKGKRYELLITTRSGLYRYAMQDVIEVTGFYGKAPIVRVCYRKNQILDVADEKMNLRQLESAVKGFEGEAGCHLKGYFVDEDLTGLLPSYRIYMELEKGGLPSHAPERMDRCLEESCLGYKSGRNMGEIGRPGIVELKRGSFRAYEKFLADSGYRVEQNKPLRILWTQEQRDFFKNYIEDRGDRGQL